MNQPDSNDMRTPAKHRIGRYEAKKRPMPRGLKILLIILCVLASLVLIALATYLILFKVGQNSMVNYDNVTMYIPENNQEILSYNDGKTIEYNGSTYQLNENITTILFLGVDRRDISDASTVGSGGQADCILLIAMDTKTGKTQIVSVSRDAYADVDAYSASGTLIGTQQMQLCLAYAFGDGRQQSCENAVKSVSRLFYGIPINSYVALDMDGILAANEAVGGVTLTSISELRLPDGTTLHVGDEITLHGKNTERYIRSRDYASLDANEDRMERQKQYVKEFAKVVIKKSKSDLSVPVNLYSVLRDYMVSSMDLSDVTFLSTCFLQHGANLNFCSVGGTYDELNGSAVCYLDETQLYETLLEVFYNPVD